MIHEIKIKYKKNVNKHNNISIVLQYVFVSDFSLMKYITKRFFELSVKIYK